MSEEVLYLTEWDPGFRTYFIRPAHGSVVAGMAWRLTRSEFEDLIGEWEMHRLW